MPRAAPVAEASADVLFESALAALDPRRAEFVRQYLVDLVGSKAAARAGYSERSAHVTASRLLSDAKVAEAVRLGRAARSIRTRITADAVVLELARVAFADLRKLASWGAGTVALVDSVELSDDVAAAVVEVAAGEHGPRLKLAPKLPALERLGRHLGLWSDGAEDRAADAAAVVAVLEAARERVARARASGPGPGEPVTSVSSVTSPDPGPADG
jgi:phage terminase small subunit